jgi:hypothetical protein
MMTIDTVRSICRALPKVTEDIKWGHDLCFIVGRREAEEALSRLDFCTPSGPEGAHDRV